MGVMHGKEIPEELTSSPWDTCEFAICDVVRHGNVSGRRIKQGSIVRLITYNRGILNGTHVTVAYNVTNRKLTKML